MARFDRIGGAIRLMRLERGWSQAELAGRAGISIAMLSRYERGTRAPSLTNFGAILDALAIDLGALDDRLDRVNERQPRPALGGVPAGVDLHGFLGYSRLPPHLVPALAEMVACFQDLSRHVAARALSSGGRLHRSG